MTELLLVAEFVGGLGLLLLGLGLLTDGLRLAGGSVLKANLRAWAKTRWRAFETGFAIALLVPSSAQSMRAAAGFVNSGLVRLENALWLTIGISFGSVVTAWLVLAVGLWNAALGVGLLLLGLGAALRFGGNRGRRAALGMGVSGVGLLLVGLSVLSTGFAELGEVRLDQLPYGFFGGLVLFLLLGALLSASLRTASVGVAAAVVATANGSLELAAGMALVAGGSFGPAAWAMLEMARGTARAKRVALMHAGFHALTSTLGILTLFLTLPLHDKLPGPLASAPFALATFHLLFKVGGALLVLPFAEMIVHQLSLRFQREELDQRRAPNLDSNLLTIPDLAVDAFLDELGVLSNSARGLAHLALKERVISDFRLRQDAEMLERRVRDLDHTAARLIADGVTYEIATVLVELPRATRGVRQLLNEVARFRFFASATPKELDPRLRTRLRQLELAVLHLVEGADALDESFTAEHCAQEAETTTQHLRDMRCRLHEACSQHEIAPTVADALCSRLDALERIGYFASEQAIGLARVLAPVGQDEPFAPPVEEPAKRILRRVA
ncbi:MAG: Na/Pi symporter [Planctomycetota bacterium]